MLLLIHLYFNPVILLHPLNRSSIGEFCDSLGKTFLTLLLGATGGLRVNLSPVKVKLLIFPLFLLKGNAILPMTAKAVCGGAGCRRKSPLDGATD